MIDQGYRKLEIYQLAHRLAVEVHGMSLSLPKFEMFEEGGQIRRSSKSVTSQIVEGYCLRHHKKDFLLYLSRAYASAEETIEHLDILHETRSLPDDSEFRRLREGYEQLCAKTFRFIQSVAEFHGVPLSVRDELVGYADEDITPQD